MIDGRPRIGDEVYIHGYIDEIRKDVVIIRNEGGYFGTDASEVILADRKTEPTISKMEQVEPQTCSFSDCDNFKNPNYERCIECKRKQIKLKTEQTERSE